MKLFKKKKQLKMRHENGGIESNFRTDTFVADVPG